MKNREPKLSNETLCEGAKVLHCPSCDSAYLHQTKIEVFIREEDAQRGNHVFVSGDTVKVDRELNGNPSPRRQGLAVYFHCEECTQEVQMNIYKHKGNTFLTMKYLDQAIA